MFVFQIAKRLPLLREQMKEKAGVQNDIYQREYIANVEQAKEAAQLFVVQNKSELIAGGHFVIPFPNEDKNFSKGNREVAEAFGQAVEAIANRNGITLLPGQVEVRVVESGEYKLDLLESYRDITSGYSFSELKAELGKFIDCKLKPKEIKSLIESFVKCEVKDELYSWMEKNFEKLRFTFEERRGTGIDEAFSQLRQPAAESDVKEYAQMENNEKEFEGPSIVPYGEEIQSPSNEGEFHHPSGRVVKPNEFAQVNDEVEMQEQSERLQQEIAKEVESVKVYYNGKNARFLFTMPAGYKEKEGDPLLSPEGRVVSMDMKEAIKAFVEDGEPLEVNLSTTITDANQRAEEMRTSLKNYLEGQGLIVNFMDVEEIKLKNAGKMYRFRIEMK